MGEQGVAAANEQDSAAAHRHRSKCEPQSNDATRNNPAQAKTARVLVVEDNLINQKVISIILQRAGYQVGLANTGIEALQKLDENEQTDEPFNIVLMDIQMPQMNGLDATIAIRAKEANTTQHIPIIAITASAISGAREECIHAGMDTFLTKPVQADKLIETVQRLLDPTAVTSDLHA